MIIFFNEEIEKLHFYWKESAERVCILYMPIYRILVINDTINVATYDVL